MIEAKDILTNLEIEFIEGTHLAIDIHTETIRNTKDVNKRLKKFVKALNKGTKYVNAAKYFNCETVYVCPRNVIMCYIKNYKKVNEIKVNKKNQNKKINKEQIKNETNN